MPSTAPRPEHPRPQFFRPQWVTLNGEWEFEIDAGDSGLERGLTARPLHDRITVPFAPEAELSGVGNTDFLEAVWYRRSISVPEDWTGRQVHLHFQAVDYDTTVWVNGVEVARHRGGSTPFSANITSALGSRAEATVVVRARDSRHSVQPRGKQATWYANSHCNYTRTTGIWQTVWLEATGDSWLERPRITPDLTNSRFLLEMPVKRSRAGMRVRGTLLASGRVIATTEGSVGLDMTPSLTLEIPEGARHQWSVQDPYLYDIQLELLDQNNRIIDSAASYAGLRSVAVDGKRVLINGVPVFQRLVLDQGYWPDGLMTAPTDEHLVKDIELGIDAGFNGARLHQKVFEERYLYHADRLGYLVWGEFGDWGASGQGPEGHNQNPNADWIAEWLEVLRRDHSHPSIIGWCPLNETHQILHDEHTSLDTVTAAMFNATKLADPSRPVVDASGYSHRVPETDIWDAHSYEQDPVRFAELLAGLEAGSPFENTHGDGRKFSLGYAGQPYFISEFGGIWWNPDLADQASGEDQEASWGYGQRVSTAVEFLRRFTGLTNVLLSNPDMFGYCYTQLTDVFQEENGLYTFDRRPKFDMEQIRAVQRVPAAYEATSSSVEQDDSAVEEVSLEPA